MSTIVFDDQ